MVAADEASIRAELQIKAGLRRSWGTQSVIPSHCRENKFRYATRRPHPYRRPETPDELQALTLFHSFVLTCVLLTSTNGECPTALVFACLGALRPRAMFLSHFRPLAMNRASRSFHRSLPRLANLPLPPLPKSVAREWLHELCMRTARRKEGSTRRTAGKAAGMLCPPTAKYKECRHIGDTIIFVSSAKALFSLS